MLRGQDPRMISTERRYACLVIAAKNGDLLAPALMSMMEKHHGTYLHDSKAVQEMIDEYERDKVRGMLSGVKESQL